MKRWLLVLILCVSAFPGLADVTRQRPTAIASIATQALAPSMEAFFADRLLYETTLGIALGGMAQVHVDGRRVEVEQIALTVMPESERVCLTYNNICYPLLLPLDVVTPIAYWVSTGKWRAFSCLTSAYDEYDLLREEVSKDGMISLGEMPCGEEFVGYPMNTIWLKQAFRYIDYGEKFVDLTACSVPRELNAKLGSTRAETAVQTTWVNADFGQRYEVWLFAPRQGLPPRVRFDGLPSRYYWSQGSVRRPFVGRVCRALPPASDNIAQSLAVGVFHTAALLRTLAVGNPTALKVFVNENLGSLAPQ